MGLDKFWKKVVVGVAATGIVGGASKVEAQDARPLPAPSLNRRVVPTTPEATADIDAVLTKLQQEYNDRFAAKFGAVQLNWNKDKGKAEIAHNGKVIGEIRSNRFADPIPEQLRRSSALDVAVEVVLSTNEGVSKAFSVGGTDVWVSPNAVAMVHIAGASIDSARGSLKLSDGRYIPLTGEGSPTRNREVKILSVQGASEPTILACLITEDNRLQGFDVLLGDKELFKRLSNDEVYKRCH